MGVTFIRFNRPLLLVTSTFFQDSPEDNFYQPVYGFVVPAHMENFYHYIDKYVGYLAALHEVANGSRDFTISNERRGLPDWKDKNGRIHIKDDDWTAKIREKAVKKLNLDYDIITLNVDEDYYYDSINEANLIVDDRLYYDLEMYLD